jgi:hypothetical protein
MEENNDFFDRALIKLNRKYGKDELVLSLKKEIKDKDIEIGSLKSEIDFLTDELSSKKQQLKLKKEIDKAASIELRKEKQYQQILTENKNNQKTIRTFRKEKEELIIRLAKTQ